MDLKVGYKILCLDLWKILDDPHYGGPAIFHQYNYSLNFKGMDLIGNSWRKPSFISLSIYLAQGSLKLLVAFQSDYFVS